MTGLEAGGKSKRAALISATLSCRHNLSLKDTQTAECLPRIIADANTCAQAPKETDAGKCWPLPFPVAVDDAASAADIG